MRVWPKNEMIRKLLKHPNAGGFNERGVAEWPDDGFTARRIADGDVLTHDPVQLVRKPVSEKPNSN